MVVRSINAIYSRVCKLGGIEKDYNWTEWEDQLLIENYKTKGAQWCLEEIQKQKPKRTLKSIYRRVVILGISTNKKPVICLETRQIYESAQDAFKQTGISYKNISSSCNHAKGRQKAGGYHWEFLSNCSKEECEIKLQERLLDHQQKIKSANSKPVYQYDIKTGKFIAEFASVSEAEKFFNFRIHMEYYFSNGYYWSYVKADNYFNIKEKD